MPIFQPLHPVSYDGLKERGLDYHVRLMCEDWNEPDGYAVGQSTVYEAPGGIILVSTPIRMTYGEGHHDTIMAASYDKPHTHPISTASFDYQSGRLVYHTGGPDDGS